MALKSLFAQRSLYAGGKFTAPAEEVKPELQKAIDATMALVRAFFPEVADQDVKLQLFLNSESAGTWQNGKLTLDAERPAAGK